jgi:hypothetical protein
LNQHKKTTTSETHQSNHNFQHSNLKLKFSQFPDKKPEDNKKNRDLIKSLNDSANELTKKFFSSQRKQKYMPFISVVSQDSNMAFNYECLLCKKENGVSKIWSQSVQNGGVSNIRRHLNTHHMCVFNQIEAEGS